MDAKLFIDRELLDRQDLIEKVEQTPISEI